MPTPARGSPARLAYDGALLPQRTAVLLPKIILVVLLAAIVASLFSGLFFLMKDESRQRRTLTALKVRVGLSIVLLIFLALAFSQGWLRPHGLQP
jgi:Protein of unknown function (DUF2909)